LTLNDHLSYGLPSFSDPDGDPVSIAVSLGNAFPFTTFNPSTNEFTFTPTEATANPRTTYEITITLTDANESP